MSAVVDEVETTSGPTPYAQLPGINWSTLKYLAVSPRLFKWRRDNPEPKKDAFVFGGAVHTLVLEPEKFDARYAECTVRRNARDTAYKEWLAAHPGAVALTPYEIKRVRALAEAILADRDAAALLRGGCREEALTWTDAETGLACKGRLDYLRPDLVIDLKTARDVMPAKFVRAASNYGYLAQAAFYHDGAVAERRIDGCERPRIIAAQPGDTPEACDVVTYHLTTDALEYGRKFYRGLLHKLLQCTEAGWWPGVAPGVQELGVSPYAAEPFAIESGDDF